MAVGSALQLHARRDSEGASHYGSHYGSRSHLGLRGSSHGRSVIGNRNRSPSPTDYWRETAARKGKIVNRVFDLNIFIHKGIEKFLDKQAVRDLIIEYDAEDIYHDGIENFFANYNEEEFLKNRSTAGIVNVGGVGGGAGRKFLQVAESTVNLMKNPDSGYPSRDKLAGPTDPKHLGSPRTRGGPWTKPRPTLWNTFFSVIRMKIFSVKYWTDQNPRQKTAREVNDDLLANFP